ncbi:MAG: hypothetical protein ACRED8_05260, partial [Caulobacteraceae bacterium]
MTGCINCRRRRALENLVSGRVDLARDQLLRDRMENISRTRRAARPGRVRRVQQAAGYLLEALVG